MATHKESSLGRAGAPPSGVDDQLDRLFALPPAEFTAARDALARALVAARDPRAAAVRSMRRLPLVIWALNRLARDQPQEVDALLEAGGRVQEGQRLALAGRGGGALRVASEALRASVERLVRAAEALLASVGHPATSAAGGRIETALRRAATDGDAQRELLRRGRFEREPAPAGPDLLALAPGRETSQRAPPQRARPAEPARAAPAGSARTVRAGDTERARARAEARERREGERAVSRGRAALRAAEQRARAAHAAAQRADRRAAETRARAAAADRSVDATRRELEAAEARLRALVDR